MKSQDLKYFLAFIPSVAAFLGLWAGGIWTFSTVLIAFAIVPFAEVFLPEDPINFSEDFEKTRIGTKFFDWLLYANLPILYGLLLFYFFKINSGDWSTWEIVGSSMSVAIIVSTVGINVAHELGHRNNSFEVFLSRALLLPAMYMHFNIEHNLGHHKQVATKEDPSSARKGENLYAFWVRSVFGVYLSAWKIEKRRLQQSNISFWSIKNNMLIFQFCQLAYLLILLLVFGWMIIPFALSVAVGGFLLLETVNYIEHYGLERSQLSSGRYEPVSLRHSWNSDHQLGRILLYELTRHSDHHYKASRKYQILKHYDESPQLPYGYPGSMLISLLPPLWFNLMDKKLKTHQQQEGKV